MGSRKLDYTDVQRVNIAIRRGGQQVWEVRLTADPYILISATVATRKKARSLKDIFEVVFRLTPNHSEAAIEVEAFLQAHRISYRRPLW